MQRSKRARYCTEECRARKNAGTRSARRARRAQSEFDARWRVWQRQGWAPAGVSSLDASADQVLDAAGLAFTEDATFRYR